MSCDLDALVAEKVMGWKLKTVTDPWGNIFKTYVDANGVGHIKPEMFHPSENAIDDYAVLQRVRETWTPEKVCEFRDELAKTWELRAMRLRDYGGFPVHGNVLYQPGDYATTALRVLGIAAGTEGEVKS